MMTKYNRTDIINKVNNLLGDKGQLLILTEFGSRLYGTDNENSDLDLKGIFLPSIDNFYSGEEVKSINLTTGKNHEKNTKDDIDITLYSIQYFIHKLLMNGDTSALDILFSFTNKDKVIYGWTDLYQIYSYLSNILNLKNTNAYVGYAIGQAKKYGVKGSRLGVYKDILAFLNEKRVEVGASGSTLTDFNNKPLSSITKEIIDKFFHESYCFPKEITNKEKTLEYLVINGSLHQTNITLEEFYTRIERNINTYGDRTAKALEDGGLDYKALSHAVRVLYQCEELYETGMITFPIASKEIVLSIKEGKMSWEEIEQIILMKLKDVEQAKEKSSLCSTFKYNKDICTELIKIFYYLRSEND